MELYESPELFEKIIFEDDVNHIQVRLVVNSFRGTEYLSIRKYYLEFDGESWMPSNEGISMPLDFSNSRLLFEGLVEILSLAESKDILEEHFRDYLDELYQK
jgi:hypothetical protein